MPSIQGWRSPNNPLLGFCHSNVFHPARHLFCNLGLHDFAMCHLPAAPGGVILLPEAPVDGANFFGWIYTRLYVKTERHLFPHSLGTVGAAEHHGTKSHESTLTIKQISLTAVTRVYSSSSYPPKTLPTPTPHPPTRTLCSSRSHPLYPPLLPRWVLLKLQRQWNYTGKTKKTHNYLQYLSDTWQQLPPPHHTPIHSPHPSHPPTHTQKLTS